MAPKFNKHKEYGELARVTDPEAWQECALALARVTVPTGHKITIAIKGSQIAWRYPNRPDLVPNGWLFESVVT